MHEQTAKLLGGGLGSAHGPRTNLRKMKAQPDAQSHVKAYQYIPGTRYILLTYVPGNDLFCTSETLLISGVATIVVVVVVLTLVAFSTAVPMWGRNTWSWTRIILRVGNGLIVSLQW